MKLLTTPLTPLMIAGLQGRLVPFYHPEAAVAEGSGSVGRRGGDARQLLERARGEPRIVGGTDESPLSLLQPQKFQAD